MKLSLANACLNNTVNCNLILSFRPFPGGVQVLSQRSEEQNEVTVFCQTHAIKQPHIIWNINGQLTQDHVAGDEWSFTPHTSSDVTLAGYRLTTWHNAVTGTLQLNKSSVVVSVGCRHKLSSKKALWAKEPYTISCKLYYLAWLRISKIETPQLQPQLNKHRYYACILTCR